MAKEDLFAPAKKSELDKNKIKVSTEPAQKQLDEADLFATPSTQEVIEAKKPDPLDGLPIGESRIAGPEDLLAAGVAGGVQGATLGFADEIAGGAAAAKEVFEQMIFEGKPLEEAQAIAEQELNRTIDESRAFFEQQRQKSPTGFLAGEVVGGFAAGPAAIKGVAGIAKAGSRALGAAGTGAEALGLSGASRVLGGAEQIALRGAAAPSPLAAGALEGAIFGAGTAEGDLTQRLDDAAIVGGGAALLGVGAKKLINVGKNLAEKGFRTRSFDKIVQRLDRIGKVRPEFQNLNLKFDPASESLEKLQKSFKRNLDNAEIDFLEEAENLGKGLNTALKDLKRELVNNSSKSYKILQEAEGKVLGIKSENAILGIDEIIENVSSKRTGEQIAFSDIEGVKQLRELQSTLLSLSDDSGRLSLSDTKTVLQAIDRESNFAIRSGEILETKERAFATVRTMLDEDLKLAVPEYKAFMESSVEPLAVLRNNVKKDLATPTTAAIALRRKLPSEGRGLKKPTEPTFKNFMDDIQELADRSGFEGDVEEFFELKTSIDRIRQVTGGSPDARVQDFIVKGLTPEKRAGMEALSKLSDRDFVNVFDDAFAAGVDRAIKDKDVKLLNVFDLMRISGGGVGQLVTFGIVTGRLAKEFSIPVIKDGIGALSKIPGVVTLAKIKKLQISPELRKEFAKSFVRSFGRSSIVRGVDLTKRVIQGEDFSVTIPESQKQDWIQEIRKSKFSEIEKSKAIEAINDDEPTNIVPKILLEGQEEFVEEKKRKPATINLNDTANRLRSIQGGR